MGAGSFSRSVWGRRPRGSAVAEAFEDGQGVAAGEDGREVLGALGPLEGVELGHVEVKDALVEEEEGAEGLVLGGGRGAAVDGEVGEEGGDLGGAEGTRVATFVEADEVADTVEVCRFGAGGIVVAAEGGAGGLDEGRGPILGRGGRGWRSARSTVFCRREARPRCGETVDLLGGTRVALEGRSVGAGISRICRSYDASAASERLIARGFCGGAGYGTRLYLGNMRIRCRFLMPDLQGLRRRRSGRAFDCSANFGKSGEREAALSRQHEDRVPLPYAGSAGATTPSRGSAHDRDHSRLWQ
jgi:hypothetical protein